MWPLIYCFLKICLTWKRRLLQKTISFPNDFKSLHGVCYLLFTVSSGHVQPSIPAPPAHLPGQPQVLSNQIVQPVNSDRVGIESVMQFVASTFAGAQLMDSHSVCYHIRSNTLGIISPRYFLNKHTTLFKVLLLCFHSYEIDSPPSHLDSNVMNLFSL